MPPRGPFQIWLTRHLYNRYVDRRAEAPYLRAARHTGSGLKKSMHSLRTIGTNNDGIFNARSWSDEGDGLLASAHTVRDTWLQRRDAFPLRIEEEDAPARLWHELTGLPRASALLLGYAVEMYLKAGLVKAYFGCSEELFDDDVRNLFRHKLKKLAQEIDFPSLQGSKGDLRLLESFIVDWARYPITPKEGANYVREVNQRTERIWSNDRFWDLCKLAERIRDHVFRIDGDYANPSLFFHDFFGTGGYWAFRIGGNLRPRLTYRRCSSEPTMTEEAIKKIVERHPAVRGLAGYKIREDKLACKDRERR
jgi:hypothetical protein